MTSKELEKLSRLLTSKEVELVLQNLSTKKSLSPDGIYGEFIPIFLKIYKPFQKIEKIGTIPISLYEANITLIQNIKKKKHIAHKHK